MIIIKALRIFTNYISVGIPGDSLFALFLIVSYDSIVQADAPFTTGHLIPYFGVIKWIILH